MGPSGCGTSLRSGRWPRSRPRTPPRCSYPPPRCSLPTAGRRLASGSLDNTVKLWEAAANYQEIRSFRGHKGAVTWLAFLPGGRGLATGSWDGTAKLWDIGDRREPVPTLQNEEAVRAV